MGGVEVVFWWPGQLVCPGARSAQEVTENSRISGDLLCARKNSSVPGQQVARATKIQNKSGSFIAPSIASVTAAANITIPADSKVSLTNTDAADGYPISGFSWVIIYKEQKYNDRSLDRATKLLKLISWMIHDGQQFSAPLTYAPLSPAAVSAGDAVLKSATYDGKPILQ